MHYTVHIKPSGYNLIVQAGESVLTSAQRSGYHFPHDCENGICGTCKGRLLEGQVGYDDATLLGLTEDEREAGYALFCLAKPLSDLVIYVEGVIGPEQLPIKKLTYSVQSLEQLTTNIYRTVVIPPADDHLIYRAGQFVEILHRDASPRPFSIANAPLGDAHELEFHIRYYPDNPFTAELLTELQTTKQLRIKGPFGGCILRKELAFPIILVAGGAGFAPLKAILEQALAEGVQQPIYLYWGVRDAGDLYLHDLVTRWAEHISLFHYIPILSAKSPKNWKGRTGWVHEAIIEDHPHLAQFHIYASGPTEMIYAAFHAFQAHGANRALFYSDGFDYPAS